MELKKRSISIIMSKHTKILIGLGILIVLYALFVLVSNYYYDDSVKINFVQPKIVKVNELDSNDILAEGAVYRGSEGLLAGVDVVRIRCHLEIQSCDYHSFGIGNDGLAILYDPKNYMIIEQSPTRIVAVFEGLAQNHFVDINLITKEVVFTEQDKESGHEPKIFKLEEGSTALQKL